MILHIYEIWTLLIRDIGAETAQGLLIQLFELSVIALGQAKLQPMLLCKMPLSGG